jgi:hypothetical protein
VLELDWEITERIPIEEEDMGEWVGLSDNAKSSSTV